MKRTKKRNLKCLAWFLTLAILIGETMPVMAAKSATPETIVETVTEAEVADASEALVSQPVVFKSAKPCNAFIDENGTIYARAAVKGAKLTTKINGAAITITVNVTK